MNIGYLRVSTDEQLTDRQIEALKPLCDELYVETLSAVSKNRPYYRRAIEKLRRDDLFIVLDLDRAYRSTKDALIELDALHARGIRFRIVNFPIDTSTAEGYLMLTVLLGMAQFERTILSRRTKEGLAAARRRGVRLGRPPKLSDDQIEKARQRITSGEETVAAIAREFDVAPWTLSRSLNRERSPNGANNQ